MKKIIHATTICPDEILPDRTIAIADGKILRIDEPGQEVENSEVVEVFDAEGLLVTPGLIDIHIHGCLGADTMDATPEALRTMSEFLATRGITSFYPTTVSNSQERILTALDNIDRCKDALTGARILGAHIEGPYINPEFKGAQNPAFLRLPQRAEYETWIEKDSVKLVTIAPELAGMDELIEFCASRGVELAVGHSAASYDQVQHAADLGVRQATHLFNGMPGLHHREPGIVGGVLNDPRFYAQIITDGIHLHPAIIALIIKIKGIERTILISDSIRAAGLHDGNYELGGQDVVVTEGAARIANGSLAGSTLMLDQAIRNTMCFSGLDFRSVIQMVTSVPAEAMKIADRKGSVEIGYDADLTFFDHRYQIAATMIAGEMKYQKNKEQEH